MRKLYLHISCFATIVLFMNQGVFGQFTSPYGITYTNSQQNFHLQF